MTDGRRLDQLIRAIRMKRSILQGSQLEYHRKKAVLQADLDGLANLKSIHSRPDFALMPNILRRQIAIVSDLVALEGEAGSILQEILKLELLEKNVSQKLKVLQSRHERAVTERETSKLHASLEQGIRGDTR